MERQVKTHGRRPIGDEEVESIVARGDVHRDAFVTPRAWRIPLYQSNGILGTCVGPFGLHLTEEEERTHLGRPERLDGGQTVLLHKDHFYRGKANLDYLLPVLKICWDAVPESPVAYRQHQSFHRGTVETSWSDERGQVRVTSWVEGEGRGTFFVQLEIEGSSRQVDLHPIRTSTTHYAQRVDVPTGTRLGKDWFVFQFQHQNRAVAYEVQSSGHFDATVTGARITFQPGAHFLAFRDGHHPRLHMQESKHATQAALQTFWNETALVDFPDADAARMFIRSAAYVGGTFSSRSGGFLAPPGALTGNMWPFPFPQDLSFIHPALLTMGCIDVAKSWIERWHRDLPAMTAYTARTFGKAGVHCPWVMPYGPAADLYDPAPPNHFYYQIHNTGYLARMAHETALAAGDESWTRAFAEPVARACAEFYIDCLKKNPRGLWELDVRPAMGQDEKGGMNEGQYLCAFWSARYTLQAAVERGLDPRGQGARILADGMDVGSLRDPVRGMYTASSRGADCFGNQKHPPQLNPLAFLPLGNEPDPETREAYRQRDAITLGASDPFFYGWTLGEFLLSSARMKDPDGFRRHFGDFGLGGKWDDELVQIYETSVGREGSGGVRPPHAQFFITEHGLMLQSLFETIVSEWWGRLELAPCFPWNAPVRFRNLRTTGGLSLSGIAQNGSCQATAVARRGATFMHAGKRHTLQKGDRVDLKTP